jgi:hypothetical protein
MMPAAVMHRDTEHARRWAAFRGVIWEAVQTSALFPITYLPAGTRIAS